MWYIYTRYIYINTYIRYIHIVYIVITMHNVVHAHIVCVCEVLHVSMCVYNMYIYIFVYVCIPIPAIPKPQQSTHIRNRAIE